MEKRMDENAAPLHVHAASTDPGFIPGITPSKAVAPEDDADAAVEPASGTEPEQDEEQATENETGTGAEDAADTDPAGSEPEADGELKAEADADAEAGEGDGDKAESPAFEAADHRGSITVDGSGLRFRLDDQEAEFDWDEIGAVEHSTSRFGRRLTVTAHTLARRAYPAEVQAPDKATLKRWTTELDDVLDAHFEE
ncbi:hypothetical protein [Streptomyces cavernicola]|uniref:Uncharacterized protein n=1 Tax=Streptomyces cavernicola TaxID=3043613 RepID=A0ABT6S7D0_9ACTN|nr:hypothetical protein [Streptomyces sp. B-S-A6]MDI3403942.1 hypothetical protein [Streptomyces sp. B-S-A6]